MSPHWESTSQGMGLWSQGLHQPDVLFRTAPLSSPRTHPMPLTLTLTLTPTHSTICTPCHTSHHVLRHISHPTSHLASHPLSWEDYLELFNQDQNIRFAPDLESKIKANARRLRLHHDRVCCLNVFKKLCGEQRGIAVSCLHFCFRHTAHRVTHRAVGSVWCVVRS